MVNRTRTLWQVSTMNNNCARLMLALCFALLVTPAMAAERPNILFIFTDDHAPHAEAIDDVDPEHHHHPVVGEALEELHYDRGPESA